MKAKVPLYRTNPTRAVLIDTEATQGAVVGVNLFNQDGSLYVPPSAGAAAPGTGIALDDVQVLGPQSVTVTGSIAEGAATFALAGDATSPGNTYLYSTGLTGTKGWNALSSMLHASANVAVTFGADGTATFDLQPLADSGAGTFKLITRDSYGRLSGTKAGTTSDVPEGTNLYYTAARVLATVLAGLSTATSAVITAADSVLSALGKLQAQISANVTAITGKLTASNNLSDVANASTALANIGALALPDPGYINGLQMAWVSATQVTVSSGAAYIQSAGSILQVPATITVTFSGLAASTWYHLYLYNNAGTAAIEYSTTAPASPYNGTARAKTGDTSRRYIGSVLTDASGNVINFSHANNQVHYKNNRLRVLSGGQAAVSTMVDCSTAIPVTGTAGQFKAQLNVSGGSSNPGAYFCPGDITAVSTVTALVSACPALSGVLNFAIVYGSCPLDSSIHLNYIIAGGSVGASGGAFLDVIGYDFVR